MGKILLVDYSKKPSIIGYPREGETCYKKMGQSIPSPSHSIVFHSKKRGKEKIDTTQLVIEKLEKEFYKKNVKKIQGGEFPDLRIMEELFYNIRYIPTEWERIGEFFHFFGTILRETKGKESFMVPYLKTARKERGAGFEWCFGCRLFNDRSGEPETNWEENDYVVRFKDQILQEEFAELSCF